MSHECFGAERDVGILLGDDLLRHPGNHPFATTCFKSLHPGF
jgi:hypothetical protein